MARRTSSMGIVLSSVIFLSVQKREKASLISVSCSPVMLCSFASAERRAFGVEDSAAACRLGGFCHCQIHSFIWVFESVLTII